MRCAMSQGIKKSAAAMKQRRCDWASLHRNAGRFLQPSHLSLYFRLGRVQKSSVLNAWTNAAEKDEATFRRLFVDALGFEPVAHQPSEEQFVGGASAGSSTAPAGDYGACESSAQVPVKKVAVLDCAVGKASAICSDLQSFISELEGREM